MSRSERESLTKLLSDNEISDFEEVEFLSALNENNEGERQQVDSNWLIAELYVALLVMI
jgi:hypothetical protein